MGFGNKTNVKNENIQVSVMRHESLELHKCVFEIRKAPLKEIKWWKRKRDAGMLVIRNVIFVIFEIRTISS